MFHPLLRRLTSLVAVARLMVVVLATVFTLPTFGGACCADLDAAEGTAASTESTQDDCCPSDARGETQEGGSDDDAPCSCPFPCSKGCAGYRVLVQVSTPALTEPVPALAALLAPELTNPTSPDPRDILHVPKPRAA